jgi:hypothetical protein
LGEEIHWADDNTARELRRKLTGRNYAFDGRACEDSGKGEDKAENENGDNTATILDSGSLGNVSRYLNDSKDKTPNCEPIREFCPY